MKYLKGIAVAIILLLTNMLKVWYDAYSEKKEKLRSIIKVPVQLKIKGIEDDVKALNKRLKKDKSSLHKLYERLKK